MLNSEFKRYVFNEVMELETRDLDQLVECIEENIRDLGLDAEEIPTEAIYSQVETVLAGLLPTGINVKLGA